MNFTTYWHQIGFHITGHEDIFTLHYLVLSSLRLGLIGTAAIDNHFGIGSGVSIGIAGQTIVTTSGGWGNFTEVQIFVIGAHGTAKRILGRMEIKIFRGFAFILRYLRSQWTIVVGVPGHGDRLGSLNITCNGHIAVHIHANGHFRVQGDTGYGQISQLPQMETQNGATVIEGVATISAGAVFGHVIDNQFGAIVEGVVGQGTAIVAFPNGSEAVF